MKRGWIIALLLVPLVALTAFTEEVIVGPEGDPYWLEIPTDGLLPAPPLLQVVTANNNDVDTVILSQFDCGQFPTMCAYIDVLDDDGIPIGGMDADSFCVYQDGSPITGFTVEEITQDFCPTSVCLVIDVSGSMNDGNKINAARNAAHNFVDNMDIYDRVAIVTFSSCYNIVQAFTSDQSLLHSKINTISANGYTAAFDGIYKGVELTLPELGSKAVIAISDGMENYSQHCSAPPDGLSYGNGWWSWPDPDGWTDDSTLIVNLSGGAVPIYTISLGSQFDPDYLVKLAAATGGSYNHAPTGGDISFIYEQIKVRICSRYLICYESPDVVQDGDWHSMQICRRDDQGACGPCDLDSCQETATPVVVRTSPTIDLESQCQPWDQAIQICADVTDLDDDQEDLTVSLFYRNDTGDPYTSVPMTHTGTTYCASIPASAITCATDIVQYYITASDGSTTVSSPPLAPQNFYEIDICDNQPPVVFAGDDMTISQCSFQQICWPASVSDPDGNLASSQIWSGPGTFNGSQICFTPTGSLDYEIVLKAIDDCGLISFDTVVIHYSVNAPPVANAGANQTLFLCAPQEICWPAGCSDANGNLVSCDLTTPYGAFDGSQICFTPTASGVYNFTLRAEDACGAVHSSTATLNITLNSAPVCQVPNDTAIFQCTPTQVCLPVGATDVDGNLKAAPCQIVTGPGSLVGGQWCYTPTGDQVVTVVVRCEDVCDAYCEDQFTVTFDVNNAPNISFGADYAAKLCAPEEICLPFTASDPNAPQATTVTLLSGGGTLDLLNSQVCFTPTGAGDYSFVIQIADSCGVTDTDDITVSVSYNTAPVASAGADQTLFLCAPEAICWPASCSDVDGNLSSCTLIAGPGTYNGSEICFTPSASGNYTFTLQATDACGATHTDDVVISVTMNSAPTVVAQADVDLFLCASEEVCVTYTPGDPDGLAGLTETMISGFGSIDPVNDRICFTPTVSGSYEFVVGVTDPCGETAQDIVVVNVTFGDPVSITCPSTAYNRFLCGPGQVSQAVAYSPDTARVSVSYGTFAGGLLTFDADTAGVYQIQVTADVECDSDVCLLTFNVTMNHAPVANAGADQTLFLCAPEAICWPASCSDVDGNLSSCTLIAGPGTYNGSEICFTPSASGNYTFTLQATDACGATHTDDVVISVTMNSAPTVVAQADVDLFLCASEEVCVTYTPGDPDGLAGLTETMISGFGSIDPVNDRICFTPTVSGSYEFVIGVTDPCGETAQDIVVVNVTFGAPVSITCPSTAYNRFLCGPGQVSQAVAYSPDTARVSVSYGTFAGGLLTFDADTAGVYQIQVTADVECDSDVCLLTFNVTMNHAPVANAGADQTLFLCAPEAICWPASCSDVDGNLSSCTLIAGPGTYNGSEICFTPSASGNYTFTLQATDACGATHTDDVVISVTMNSAPTVVAQADLDVSLCAGEEVCVTYTPGDPDGLAGLTETMISGFGSIDPVNDRICFTPTVSGSYEFVVGVTDPCGETAQDIVVVNVTIGASATITCPADPININLCSVTEVCQMVAVQPSTASVQVSMGTYVNGSHCFTPTASGTYNVRIIATKACGADTCDLVYNVDIGQAADIECPAPQDLFICEAGQVCIPVTVAAPGATFVVAPIGYYNNGSVCFEADTSGHYVIDISATTPCGSDACQIIADITINSAPVAADPATPVDLFLCNAQQVCYQFAATDVDGGALTWSKLSGNGTISAGGEWCFNAAADGAYTVIAKVTDACGATDQVTLTYNVDLNSAPVVTLPADLTTFLCEGQPYCFNYSESDVDDNLASAVLLQGPGTLDPQSQEVCFTPTAGGTYTFVVEVTDECGATDQDAINITIQQGTPVTVSCPGNDAVFLCEPEELCYPVTVSHPDAMVTVSPVGSYDYVTGEVCFTPDVAGPYTLTVQASNPCGIASCQFTVDVTFNSAPVADDPSTPIDMFLCVAQQVCYQFTATDVDGGALTWSKVSGNGTVSAGGEWCFNATADGSYSVVAKVTDACGATDQVTLTYNIDLNAAPVVTLPADITTFLCEGQPFCLPYSSTDVDGNLVSTVLIQGPGTLDPQTGEICFTPATSGTYAFVVEATDACGATDQDAINVTIQLGSAVSVTCPGDDAVTLCAPEELCYPITVSHPDATVTVSPLGSYDSQTGEVCFTPSAAGSYTLTVEATNSCGSASCEFTVDVSLNSPPVAVDPGGPFDAFQCETQLICYQFSATDIDGGDLTWTRISGAGAVGTDGRWCFAPSATGQYSVVAEVADECGLTDQVSLTYNVVMNTPPVVAFEADASAFICEPTELCYGYTVADAEDNVVSETLLSGAATLDPVNNTICFTANAAGVFTFVIQVDDACGGTDTDEIVVTVTENRPPVASAGADQNLFLCGPSEVCFGVACSDPDNNLTTCELVSGPGVLDNGQVCFTPSAAGVYDFVIRATDECGLTAEDAVQVTVTMNSSPICQAIGDQSYFQCDPTEVSVPITVADPDDNFDHCEIVSGPGSIVNGAWVYTPAASETRTVIIRCLDECGAFCEQQFTAVFVINAAPVADAGPNLTVFKCNPGEQVCWPAGCTDVDDNLESCNLQGTGTLAGGDICFHPSAEGNYRFILTAVDECGKTDVDSVWITVSFNEPPVIDIPDHLTIFRDEPGQVCFGIDMYDNDNHPFYYELTSGDGVIANNQICFEATGSGDYCFEVRAWDECGAETTAAGCVEVEIDECLNVQIEEVPDVIQGHQRAIDVMLNGSGKPLGGYDLLISYDASALVALAARPGDLFESCGWEYFTYRLGAQGQCDGCPSGLLRITAIADINNGAYHPGCYWQSQVGSIATIDFLVTNDRTLECQFAPVRFFWMDCEDNGFSSVAGDTLWLAREVFDYSGTNITNASYGFPGYFGPLDSCMLGGDMSKSTPMRCVDFTNGGFDIICADSIDARGDLNLNGLAHEIADAVTYTNYFLHGLDAFTVSVEGQIAASDVNADGVTLTVGDLVYLIRVIIGDAPAVPKQVPDVERVVELARMGDALIIGKSSQPVGALHLVIDGEITPVLSARATGMDLQYHFDGSKTRILVFDEDGLLSLGEGPVLTLGRHAVVEKVEAGSFDGLPMVARLAEVPYSFELHQSYPNPFNPTATIRFGLPTPMSYRLVIYNIIGQTVKVWEGEGEVGYTEIVWDASANASGVYFYRLTAGSFSESKKMILLK